MTRHQRHVHPRRRGGYLIVELLFGLAILTVFGLVAGRLFHFNFRVLHQTTVQADDTTRFDAALARLRGDVSTATSWESSDPQTIVIHTSGGDVRWHADAQSLSRTSGDAERRWHVGQPITFAKDGEVVLVQTSADPASALAMAREGGPR